MEGKGKEEKSLVVTDIRVEEGNYVTRASQPTDIFRQSIFFTVNTHISLSCKQFHLSTNDLENKEYQNIKSMEISAPFAGPRAKESQLKLDIYMTGVPLPREINVIIDYLENQLKKGNDTQVYYISNRDYLRQKIFSVFKYKIPAKEAIMLETRKLESVAVGAAAILVGIATIWQGINVWQAVIEGIWQAATKDIWEAAREERLHIADTDEAQDYEAASLDAIEGLLQQASREVDAAIENLDVSSLLLSDSDFLFLSLTSISILTWIYFTSIAKFCQEAAAQVQRFGTYLGTELQRLPARFEAQLWGEVPER